MPHCECGAFITQDYARVFADRNGRVRKCINCEGLGAYSPEIDSGGELRV